MESPQEKKSKTGAFNRRNFIKLVAGGTIGISLTPLPWKLIDDSAIWTQNWPWVPVPAQGPFTHEKTVCTLCPGACGLLVRKAGERAVQIQGRLDYPVNSGSICPLGAGGLQLLYNENIRFTGPMKRVGERGTDRFQPISWDEALQELAAKIGGLRNTQKPETLAAIDGNPVRSSAALLIQRFLQAIGSPNYFPIPTMEHTYDLANRLMMGQSGPMAYDLENADFILSFGCGLIEGWGAPGRLMHAWGLWRKELSAAKVKIIQIEARASNTASKADQWLAVIPGTETALALGMAHVIIKQGLFHKEFVGRYAFGFEDWTSADGRSHIGFKRLTLEKYGPEKVAGMTGLKPDDIINLAQAFAKAQKPLALAGSGKGDRNGSLLAFMAIQALNALVGNINQPGGPLVPGLLPLKPWPNSEYDDIAKNGLQKPRLDQTIGHSYPFSPVLLDHLTQSISQAAKPPVNILLIFSANPAYTLPDNKSFKQALSRVPFIVSFSPYKDETTLMADLVLPDHTCLEKTEDIVWPPGLQYPFYGLSRPVVDPLYQTRQTGDVLISLAEKIGGSVKTSMPWRNFEESLKARAEGLFKAGGQSKPDASTPVWLELKNRKPIQENHESFEALWKAIKADGCWYRPRHDYKNWDKIFKTPSGKFEFFSTTLERTVSELAGFKTPQPVLANLGITAENDEAFLPHYEVGPSLAGKDQFPLLLMPYTLINLSSDWLPNPPYLNKTLFDRQLRQNSSFAEIHPSTAADYGLREGDRVVISSSRGTLAARITLFSGAMPGVVFMPIGFGHQAYDDFQRAKGANPFEILERIQDPLSGQPVWWSTYVKIAKA